MDTHVVPDTSVVIKWFRQGENLAEQALALRAGYLDGRTLLSVPALLAYELTNVLRYKEDLTTVQVEEAVQSLFDMGLAWVPPSAAMMRRAAGSSANRALTSPTATAAATDQIVAAVRVSSAQRAPTTPSVPPTADHITAASSRWVLAGAAGLRRSIQGLVTVSALAQPSRETPERTWLP